MLLADVHDKIFRLATGRFVISDWKAWSKHDINQMEEEERRTFIEEGTMLCAKKKDMAGFNQYHLKRTGRKI